MSPDSVTLYYPGKCDGCHVGGGGTGFSVQTPPLPGFPVISSVIQRPPLPRHQAWGIKIGPTPSTRCRWPGKSCILLTPSTEGSGWYNQSPTGDQEISHTLTRDTDRKQTRDYLWYQPRVTARTEHKCAQSVSVLTFIYRGRCDQTQKPVKDLVTEKTIGTPERMGGDPSSLDIT